MKKVLLTGLVILLSVSIVSSQKRPGPVPIKPRPAGKAPEVGQSAIVIDETLSVLRETPSLYSDVVQRMHRGRKIQILGTAEADGVKFYKVTAPPANFGWVQADAVFGKFRIGDEERLARLVQASNGFDQIEIAATFFDMYPESKFKPPILLLYGDLLEEVALKLSKDAASRLSRQEMAATGAPLHSYFLNYVSLDRYRKLGIMFVFNTSARQFHYDGASWKELANKYASSPEAAEAKNRLDSLRTKMAATLAN